MEKEVVWTHQARKDLQTIYGFYCSFLEEQKAFSIVEEILERADALYQSVIGGTRYVSNIDRNIPYQKLVVGHFIIIYRQEEQRVYVNRVFDTRQNPQKLKV